MTIMGNVFKSGKKDSENLEARAAIIHLASQIGVGQWSSQRCPQCEGGATHERSLSLNIETNGVISFHCHRAACGFSGKCYSTPGTIPIIQAKPLEHVSHLNPLEADLYPLGDKDLAFFESRYNIPQAQATGNIRRTQSRYALRILSPLGETRGWITRRPYNGSPADTAEAHEDSQYGVKALTYMEKDEPVMSWYYPEIEYDRDLSDIYLVEDQLSALRLCAYFDADPVGHDVAAVALLGSGINASKVAEIQRTGKHATVHIALDRDATGAAFAMARKWGQGFAKCRVVLLDKDIKDCSNYELDELAL